MHINPILQQGGEKIDHQKQFKIQKGDLCSIDNPFKAFACDPGV